MNEAPAIREGSVFPYDKDDITVEPFEIPAHWPVRTVRDAGAAVKIARNPDSGVVYVIEAAGIEPTGQS